MVQQPGVTDAPTTTVAQPDCPAVGLRYIGAGISAAVIDDPLFFTDGERTDDPGPVHAERTITVQEGQTDIEIGRFFAPPDTGAGVVQEGGLWAGRIEADDAWIIVRSEDRDRVVCLLQSATYDRNADVAGAQSERMLAAINGDGDAVALPGDGRSVLLFDGTDPDDPPPLEGETTAVDGVAMTFTADAWIGICCEPVAGSLLTTAFGTEATYETSSAGFGHAPSMSPDDRYLATIDYDGLSIRDTWSVSDPAFTSIDTSAGFISELQWVGIDRLAALIVGETSTDIVVYQVTDGQAAETLRTEIPQAGYSDLSRYTVSLAGWDAGIVAGVPLETATPVLFLAGHSGDVSGEPSPDDGLVEAFDVRTLERVPSADRTVAGGVRVSIVGGQTRWVDGERRLWTALAPDLHDAIQVPGEFIWVG